ncbi:hypothetical protein, conserved [Angomonas deanei]|uniref:Uncharacterized protein n=1 Tax=Angomonas deanei TaxID=59799 RepID=A0A7G2CSD9_9TRYP|nr:hypothetical protein, conserved [Angomonas deanei]
MMRRNSFWLATTIPRSVWDPKHHNPNWSDSYAADIAARRHWPAKKWSVALEPRTPTEWLQFSHRNLAYAYNGALRACSSFPEMVTYYNEMKQRGVKVDVDTLNVILTRAARYEHIETDDIFLLFDEMTALGARPDIAVVETLHTVLEHSASKPFEWREARRRQLVELYNHLAVEEIARLKGYRANALLAAQLQRIRGNLRELSASLSPSVYKQYFPVIESGTLLLQELHHFLWEFVSPDHPAMEVPSLQLRIPHIGTVMKRPPVNAAPGTIKATDFEDTDVCSVILAAVERSIDMDLHDERPISERRLYLSLLSMLTLSGVLYTADLIAQLMELVKYSVDDRSRDTDAQRLLRYALRGSSAAHDEEYRRLWKTVEKVVDARTVGRYIAARDPWSTMRICYDEKFSFRSYPPPQLVAAHKTEGEGKKPATEQESTTSQEAVLKPTENVEGVNAELMVGEIQEDVNPTKPAEGSNEKEDTNNNSTSKAEIKTVEGLKLRWDDVKRLIEKTGALSDPRSAPHAMEVFTGQMVFLRVAATGYRYGTRAAAFTTQAAGDLAGEEQHFTEGVHITVWIQLLQCITEVHADMEKYIADHPTAEPEFECWESMLILLRCILDYSASQVQHGGGAEAQKLFDTAAALRSRLVEESLTRFNGRMRILWLQES